MICILATIVALPTVCASLPPDSCVHARLGGRRAVVGPADASRESVTEPPDAATIPREILEATVIDGSDAVKHFNLERHSPEAALSAPPDLTASVGSTSPCGARRTMWGVEREYNRGCVSTSAPTLLLLLLAACGSGLLLLRILAAGGGLLCKWAQRFGATSGGGLLGMCAPRSGAALGQRASKAVRPRLSKSRGLVAFLLLLCFLPVARAGSGEAGSGEAGSGEAGFGEQGSGLWGVPPPLPPPSPPSYPLAYYTVTTTPGSWPSEVSWDFWCGGEVVLSSVPYTGSDECRWGLCPDFQTEYGVSLSPGVECELVMKDLYGDGWEGASWSGLGQEGLAVADGYEERKSFVVPFAPPSPPPLAPSPPRSPPRLPPPPLPPLVPGEAVAHTPQGIRDEINKAVDQGRNASVFIPPGARLAFSSNVECSGDMHLSVRSSGEGATLDGKKSSNMFYISGGCSLYLEALHFVDGRAGYGGAVYAYGAGDIAMKDVSFTGCEASEVSRPSLPRTARTHKPSPLLVACLSHCLVASLSSPTPLTPRLHCRPRAVRRRYERVPQRRRHAGGRQLQRVHGCQGASPTPAHACLPPHTHARTPSRRRKREEQIDDGVAKGGTISPKGRSGPARPLSLSDGLAAHACPPQLAQDGGGMFVYSSVGVSLDGASFSECTSGRVRTPAHACLPRAHTHARHRLSQKREKKGEGQGVARGARFPQRATLGQPALSQTLTASPLILARPNSRSPEEV